MAPAMQPAEIQFAQRLASHEKGIRDRAVKKLRQYISVKTQRETGGFSQEELLKIWKGLFYCMWVQDEPLLQEELANTISQLIHVVNNSEAQHLFLQTFWQTVNREWPDIDGLRLDKYHMLIRLVLRQSFEVLKRNGWEESRIKLFLDVLMKEILHPESQSPNGVKFHFIDIYLDELSKVGGKELLANQNLKFIDPFCKVAAKTKDQTLVQTIARGVFEVIVDQSPFAPEETVEEQKTKVSDSDLSEEETSGKEMTWRKAIRRKKTGNRIYLKTRQRCFDYKAVADRLLEITNRKNIPPFNRKRLSKLIKKFQDLSEGSISHLSFAEDTSADEDDQTLSQGRHKKKGNKLLEKTDMERGRGTKFSPAEEEEGAGSIPKRKRKKKKKNHLRPEHFGPGGEATCPEQNGSREPEAGPGRAREAGAAELGTVATPGPQEQSGLEPTSLHSRRKRLRKRSLRVQVEGPEGAAPAPAGGAPVLKRRRELGALLVNGSGPPTPAWPLPRREGPPASPADRGDCPALPPRAGKLKKRRGEPGAGPTLCLLASRIHGWRDPHLALCTQGSGGALSPLKKQLRTQKDFVKFDAASSPKAPVLQEGQGREEACGPCLTCGLAFIRGQNSRRRTRASWSVHGPLPGGLHPEQRPLHGVLKTPSSSPASTPLGTKKPLTSVPKRRPTAIDFF
uniref:Ribosomal RNA processing 1B n=1 Tax=Balaenoptera musculus TaxID=9771 RepID=A0A8C0CQL7_BALMU